MRKRLHLVADPLRSGSSETSSCEALQFVIWLRLFGAVCSTQLHGLTLSLSSRSGKSFMLRVFSKTSEYHPSYHHSSPARKSLAFATAAGFVSYVESNGRRLAIKK